MKKPLLGVIVIALSIFGSFAITKTALAYFIGGHISLIEVPEVALTEASGYDCDLQGGSTIEILGPNGIVSYFVPSYVTPVTGHLPSIGQSILGINEGETTITCTRDEEGGGGGFLGLGEGEMVTSQISLIFPNITYFGTSAI